MDALLEADRRVGQAPGKPRREGCTHSSWPCALTWLSVMPGFMRSATATEVLVTMLKLSFGDALFHAHNSAQETCSHTLLLAAASNASLDPLHAFA